MMAYESVCMCVCILGGGNFCLAAVYVPAQ